MADPMVIIPYRNGGQWIGNLLRTLPADLDALIVNDQSAEPMPRIGRPRTQVIDTPTRSYWAGACNFGASLRPGRDLLFLNQDIHFHNDGWLPQLRALAERVDITGNWVRGHPAWPRGYVDGVFMFVKRAVWDAVGGMDATNYPMWGSSCLFQTVACRKGYRAEAFADLGKYMVHHRAGNLGQSFRQALQEDVGHYRNDGNLFRRVPPYVSVVITAHGDYDKYLPQAMEAISDQTRQDWNITISLDGTARPELQEMARAYVDPWRGIQYVQQPPGRHGPSIVRNAGVKACKGRFFFFMQDGDDWAEPNAIEALLAAAESSPGSFAYGDLRWVGDRSGVRRLPEYDFPRLLEANYIPSMILCPVSAWKDAGGYPLEMTDGWDDYGFNIALGVKGHCGVHVPQVTLNYRRHGESRNHNSQKIRSELRAKLRGLFPDVFERRFPVGCCGGKARSTVPPAKGRRVAQNTVAPRVGAGGLVEIKYTGNLGASFIVTGRSTGTKYVVRRGWVGWMNPKDAELLVAASREYSYTGRASGGAKVKAPAPAPRETVTTEAVEKAQTLVVREEVPEASWAAVEEVKETLDSLPGAFACQAGGCGRCFKTQRGLDTHRRIAHGEN